MQIKKRERVANRDKARDYINGPQLYQALIDWYDSGEEEIPIFIVKAVTQICNRLATKNNFKNYTYIDEMKSNALMSCIIALQRKNFDPKKTDNPFAYFTRIAYNGFIHIINQEHQQVYIKHKSLENHIINQHLQGIDVEVEDDNSGRLNHLVDKFENKGKKNE